MKVLCIGEALIDMICTDRGSTLAEGSHFLKKTGGAPTNVAAAVAALGGDVTLAAKVGSDPFGDQLIREMESFGVSTEYMTRDTQYFTTLAFVSLMANGERDFVFSRGADAMLSGEDLKELYTKDFGIFHFGSATAFLDGKLRNTYYDVHRQAIANNAFISFDPNYRHLLFKDDKKSFIEHSWNFIKACDFFKVSDEEAMLLTSAENLDTAIKILKEKSTAHFAITIGKHGTVFRYLDQIVTIPSIEIDPIDTTGAGDAFVGAVLFQLSRRVGNTPKNTDLSEWLIIINNANKAGARTCEYVGAMEAFKQLNNKIFFE